MDGEIWFDYFGVSVVIDVVICSGCIVLVVVFGIDNINVCECVVIFGGCCELVFDIVECLLLIFCVNYLEWWWVDCI